jgi:hypothetical protein
MSELEFPTSLGTSSADEIRLLGRNLTEDLMGQVGFGELGCPDHLAELAELHVVPRGDDQLAAAPDAQ